MKKYDVAIIGAGTAGLAARREVAKMTSNYVVIDPGPLGTTCARVGCMPSKVLLQVANDFYRAKKFPQMGIHGSEKLTVNWEEVLAHTRSLRDRFVRGVTNDMNEWTETHLLRKRAKFIDTHTLDLGDEKIYASKIIIAAGSSPIMPAAWSEYKDFFIDTNEFFELPTLPKRLAVIGAGVIGLELGQALHRLGVETVTIGNVRNIGGITDPKIQDYAIQKFGEEFPLFLDGAEILGVDKDGIRVKSGSHEWVFDKVLLAMGRKPNLAGLGLAEIGIALDKRGIPEFDPTTYRIGTSNLYIAGDVNAERPILHEASDQGRIAGYNAARSEDQCFVKREMMAISFTYPNLASVGKSYDQLVREKADFVIGDITYEGQGRAIVMLEEKGLVHIYADRKTGLLLGAELMAPHADHMAHLLNWVISLKQNVHQVLALPFYHPVLEEGLRTALRKIAVQVEAPMPPLEVLRCQDRI